MEGPSLKLITLNCWGGRAFDDLLPFFARRAGQIDVFCLQEVFDADQATLDARHPGEKLRGDLFRRILDALPGYQGSFAYFDDAPTRQSLAMFVRHGVPVRLIEDFIVHQPETPHEVGSIVRSARKLMYVTLLVGGREVTIANFHGLWVNGPKTDTPERIEQAEKVRSFLRGVPGPKVLCGDFNLLPETESLAIMKEGMRDLVKDHGIASTRTPKYRHFENPAEPNFADYVLVSPDVRVHRFEVLPDVVSDHAPLFAELS